MSSIHLLRELNDEAYYNCLEIPVYKADSPELQEIMEQPL